MKEMIENYKDFVYSKLNKGKEDNAFLWLPESRYLFGNKNIKDSHLEVSRNRLFLQGIVGFVDEFQEFMEVYKFCKKIEEKPALNKADMQLASSLKESLLLEAGDIFFYASLIDITYPNTPLNIFDFEYSMLPIVIEKQMSCLIGLGKKVIFQERKDLLPELVILTERY